MLVSAASSSHTKSICCCAVRTQKFDPFRALISGTAQSQQLRFNSSCAALIAQHTLGWTHLHDVELEGLLAQRSIHQAGQEGVRQHAPAGRSRSHARAAECGACAMRVYTNVQWGI